MRPGTNISGIFSTAVSTGAITDATGTPTALLYVNGVDSGGVVTVTKPTGTGLYKFVAPVPASVVPGDLVQVLISATVSAVAQQKVVFSQTYSVSINGDGQVDIGLFKGQPARNAINLV